MNEIIWHEIDKDFWCETKYVEGIISNLQDKIDEYSINVSRKNNK